ncbi:MAG: SDR family oxidoreductase [Candidatus Omnitrophica bacterium]|nr:SDR family oxidoreductase [Candidatus Omnitrophota bacterium]
MKALVTGGAGFIGSHLTEALVHRGHRVRVLDDLSSGTLRNLVSVKDRVEFIRGDIRNHRLVGRAVKGMDVVFHQAALRSVPKSVEDPVSFHEVNVTATLQLFLAARAAKVKRVVYASSSSVYGECPKPQIESKLTIPLSPYACSKLADEIYGKMFTRLYGLETVGLRYFNVFGPRQSLENEYAVVIPKFIVCYLKNQPPPIHGDGLQTRDFTYVENVVQANLKAAASRKAAGHVFNVASGTSHSVKELADLIRRHLKSDIKPVHTPTRRGDVRHTCGDPQLAGKLLGFRVTVPFLEGLKRTIAWFQEHPETWTGR